MLCECRYRVMCRDAEPPFLGAAMACLWQGEACAALAHAGRVPARALSPGIRDSRRRDA